MSDVQQTTTKGVEYYMALSYSILLIPPDPDHEDDTWFAEVPELKGCMTSADTREEVLVMIEDAKRTWIEGSLEYGDPIPEPTRK